MYAPPSTAPVPPCGFPNRLLTVLLRPFGSSSFRSLFSWLIWAPFLASATVVRADTGNVALNDSVAPVGLTSAVATPFRIARSDLTKAETDEMMQIEIALPMRRFDELLTRLQRGESISSAEMDATYRPTAADFDQLAAWLESQGLAVTHRDDARLALFASGTVSQLARIFAVSFARVTGENNVIYTSAITAPNLPASVAPLVLGINGLQPHLRPRKHTLTYRPLDTQSTTGNGPPFLPDQIIHAYGGDNMGMTGAGQKIAIVIDTFPADSDLTSFWSTCGIAQSLSHIEKIQVVSGTLTAPPLEATLDVEWTSALAPSATVRIYATQTLSTTNIDLAYSKLYSDLPANPGLHQLSLSFGLGENVFSLSQLRTDAQYFANFAAAGVTTFVSTGDGGSSPGPGGAGDHSGTLQPEYPSSDPSVIAVGGTSLYVDSSTGLITSESAWYDGGGGVSARFTRPAWQTGTGVPSGASRLVPDVSAAADLNTGGFLILNGTQYQVGGTSWSAPVWAGFCALVNQARAQGSQSSLGLLGPTVYPLLGTANFHDVTTGSNGPSGTYNAGAGFDLCTGIGTPNFGNLLLALAPVAPAITSQPQSQSSPSGQPVTLSISASGPGPVTYRWQVSTDHGSTWTSLNDSAPYSGTSTNHLLISPATEALNGDLFRCLVSNPSAAAPSTSVSVSVATGGSDAPLLPEWSFVLLFSTVALVGSVYVAKR